MGHKTLVGGTAYNVSGGKVLVDGTAYGIKKGRTLVGGTGYDIGFGTAISELDIGTSVFMNFDGAPTEFIIVHKGIPDASLYDASCDGVWLMMKCVLSDIYDEDDIGTWDEVIPPGDEYATSDYSESSLHAEYNSRTITRFDSNIQNAIKQVKIPYTGSSMGTSLKTGSNGLSTKIFAASGYEIGGTPSRTYKDGACLSYFNGATNETRKATRRTGTSSQSYWCRTATYSGFGMIVTVKSTGAVSSSYVGSNVGSRLFMIMPHDIVIDDAYNVIA